MTTHSHHQPRISDVARHGITDCSSVLQTAQHPGHGLHSPTYNYFFSISSPPPPTQCPTTTHPRALRPTGTTRPLPPVRHTILPSKLPEDTLRHSSPTTSSRDTARAATAVRHRAATAVRHRATTSRGLRRADTTSSSRSSSTTFSRSRAATTRAV